MGRRSQASALDIWMNGRHAGTWRVSSAKGHEIIYVEEWASDPEAFPISLSMQLAPKAVYRGEVVANYFENLLPENRAIRERLRTRFKAASTAAFDLLAQVGRDCVGAVQLLPLGHSPEDAGRIEYQALSEAQVARLLRDGYGAVLRGTEEPGEDSLRISLPGMQEKVGLLRHRGRWCRPRGATPTTHILKLPMGVAPSGIDLRTSVQNEWLCVKLVRAFGIDAANCTIERFEDIEVLAVERFDRRAGGKAIERLPQEDFAQLTGIPPQLKYESDGGPGIARIMRQLGAARDPVADRLRFMRMQVVYWLLCAIDGHAKNFSVFIEPGGRFRLTPAYDVLSAYPLLGAGGDRIAPEKARMSMAVWGANRHYRWAEIRRSHFLRTARDCGAGDAQGLLDELVALAPRVVESVTAALPAGFPAKVAEPILAGVMAAAKRLARKA